MPPIVSVVLLVGCGVWLVAIAYYNQDSYMNHRRAQVIISMVGRGGARVFYATLGIVAIVYGAVYGYLTLVR